MPKRKSSRPLSTIEQTVLGLAYLKGPCTIYVIMKDLSTSASTYHKSRAGTAYSVAHRLVQQGLLTEDEEGQVQISESGLETLRAWIGPPISLSDVSYSVDLVRLRVFFFDALPDELRIPFIEHAIKGLEQFSTRLEPLLEEQEAEGAYFGVLAAASILVETRSRIRWLNMVREWIEHPQAGDWATRILARIRAEEW